MLFLHESAHFYGADEISVEEALVEQLEVSRMEGQLQVALLEADFIFHDRVLTESEDKEVQTEKKVGFFRRVIESIKNLIAKIVAAVRKMLGAIKNFFTRVKSDKEHEIEEKAKKAGVDKKAMGLLVREKWMQEVLKLTETLQQYVAKVKGVKDAEAAAKLKAELEKAMSESKKAIDEAHQEKAKFVPYGTWFEAMTSLNTLSATVTTLAGALEEEDKVLSKLEGELKDAGEKADEISRGIQTARLKVSMLTTLNAQCATNLSRAKSIGSASVLSPEEKDK